MYESVDTTFPWWFKLIMFILIWGSIFWWSTSDHSNRQPKYDEQMYGTETPYEAP